MPLGDWQFWVCTLVAFFAIALILRPMLPTRRRPRTNLTVSAPPRR